jgi:hypothetical protein
MIIWNGLMLKPMFDMKWMNEFFFCSFSQRTCQMIKIWKWKFSLSVGLFIGNIKYIYVHHI